MAFSAATCLTSLGSVNPTDPISFYSDKNNFLTPFTSTTLSQITSSSCPYIVKNIPNGTKVIRLVSENGYCIDIDLECDNICDICDLTFQNYISPSPIVAKITTGDLIGPSCDNQIDDYLVYWYGPNTNLNPNATTNFAFSSGKGNDFLYDYEHPLIGSNVVPVQDGNYKPVIQKVRINDKWFSLSGGTGSIPANLSCLDPIVVLPCNCVNNTNTTNVFKQYSHYVEFDLTSGKIPSPISFALVLNANTGFVPWSFQGLQNADRIQTYFRGSAYSNIIGLEDYLIGNELSTSNLGINSFPKSAKTQNFYSKTTILSNITVNNGDRIIFTVTPKENNTSWKFYFTCLQDWNCDECISTSDYKIIKSELTGYTKIGATTIQLKNGGIQLKGCSVLDYAKSPLSLFTNISGNFSGFGGLGISPTNPFDIINNSKILTLAQLSWNKISCFDSPNSVTPSCKEYGSPITVGLENSLTGTKILVFSGNTTFVDDYYNELRNRINSLSGITVTDNTKLDYYTQIRINLPISQTKVCDDSLTNRSFTIHTSSNFERGTISGVDFLRITANTTSYGLNVTDSELNCSERGKTYVRGINNDATGNTPYNIYYSPVGAVSKNITQSWSKIVSAQTVNTEQTFSGYYITLDNEMSTIPFVTGSTTFIKELSGVTCEKYFSEGEPSIAFNTTFRTHYLYSFKIVLTNPANVEDFDVYADDIVNGVRQNTFTNLVLRWSNGIMSNINSNYVI